MAKKYLIDESLANSILEYLSHQPYREVYKLVLPLQGLRESVPPEELIDALRNLVFAARTSGGVAGRDDGLCEACNAAEAVLEGLQ
jgi:hypothetical protein